MTGLTSLEKTHVWHEETPAKKRERERKEKDMVWGGLLVPDAGLPACLLLLKATVPAGMPPPAFASEGQGPIMG